MSSPDIINKKQIWYITGSTSGTGLSLVLRLLELGHKVVGTSRDLKKFNEIPQLKDNSNFLGLEVDLINEVKVKESIEKTISHFGDLTHIVNNAGYGMVGSLEEASDKENRDLMDCLYFGPFNVIRSALPHMREKKYGYIFNISSIAGIKGYPRFGSYSAAKFAMVGATESLAEDVKPFNIKVSCVILGYFKTGFQSGNGYTKNQMPEYNTKPLWEGLMNSFADRPAGDPHKFAEYLIEKSTATELPCNLIVGPIDVFYIAEQKIKDLTEQVNTQKARGSDVCFDNK